MQSFKDSQGREWHVTINVAAAKRCRALAGVDLLKLAEDRFRPLGELLADVVTFVDVLYCCSAPADGKAATDEEFGRSLGGDSLRAAKDAWCKELVDFFEYPAQRQALQTLLQTLTRADQKLQSRALADLGKVDPEAESERIVAELLKEGDAPTGGRTAGAPSTSAPASSASAPTPSPSAS